MNVMKVSVLALLAMSCKSSGNHKSSPERELANTPFNALVAKLLPTYCTIVLNDSIFSSVDGKDDEQIGFVGSRYLDGGVGAYYTDKGDYHRLPEDMKDKECTSNAIPPTYVFTGESQIFEKDDLSGSPLCQFEFGETLDELKTFPVSLHGPVKLTSKDLEARCGVSIGYVSADVKILELIKRN